jgi:hypothetical protein
MSATTTARSLQFEQRRAQLFKFLFAMMFFVDSAFATGTGTTTGSGGAAAAQARITAVATGWQNIVMGVGVAILVIAWSVIGYAIAFNGKTMKDMQNPAIGTTIAGLAPVLVGWLFS